MSQSYAVSSQIAGKAVAMVDAAEQIPNNFPFSRKADMPGTTLNNTIHTGIILGTGHTHSPYTIASHGAIEPTNSAAYGLFANTSVPAATVANFGIVSAGTSGTAIEFADTGYLLNAGRIAGAGSYPGTGVYMAGGGTVTNMQTGDITADRIAVHGVDVAATVNNAGTIAGTLIGVRLSGGGLVNNEAGGIITGEYAVQGHINAATVVNSGTIIGQYSGVGLYGGQITNQAGGTISQLISSKPGVIDKAAAYINDGTGTITNYGMINGYYGAALLTGGLISNKAGGTITGSATGLGKAAYITGGVGTVMNAGLLQAADGAVLEEGGTISNALGGTITGGKGAEVFGAAGYISNAGLISGGVVLGDYGTVTNLQGGTIYGGAILDGGTLFNSGLIHANADGVSGEDPVSIFNDAGATIAGDGVGVFLFAGGSIDNAGRISGTTEGIVGRGVTSVLNEAGGVISNADKSASAVYIQSGSGTVFNAGTIDGGYDGIDLAHGGTVETSGTIIGGGGTAVQFSGDFAARLIVSPKAVFDGVISGGAGSNVLELAQGVPGQTGTLAGVGTQYTGFTQIQFDQNADWVVSGNAAAFNQDTISGFDARDTIDVTDLTVSSALPENIMLDRNYILNIDESDGDTLHLTFSSAPAGALFTLTSDGHGGTDITDDIPCFCAGTHILGPHGEVLVEDIRVGDRLMIVHENGPVSRRVIWTGRRRIDVRRHPRPAKIAPVRIMAGAFGKDLPKRDLRVSPDHALYIDGYLIPAGLLVNGTSVSQELGVLHVTYHHIELEQHEVLLAENLPVESFLDTGSRSQFGDGAVVALHPDFMVKGYDDFCAPLVLQGPIIEVVRERLRVSKSLRRLQG